MKKYFKFSKKRFRKNDQQQTDQTEEIDIIFNQIKKAYKSNNKRFSINKRWK